ncbi:MAG: cytochrome c biogenesis protein CcsA [Nitrospinota bacterium]
MKKTNTLGCGQKAISVVSDKKVRLGMVWTSFILICAALYMAVVWSPDAKGEPVTYRIIYFHVASAIMSYVGFFIAFVGSILFLSKGDLRYDRWAKVGADLGVHFCFLMIVSGMIWGKQRWGAWWLWEPRLTTAMILFITYIGYLILRHVIEIPMTRARYAAVYGIIAFIDVPIVHYAIKIWGSIMHPVVSGGGPDQGLAPEMMLTLRFSILAFLVTFGVMYMLRLHVENLEAVLARSKADSEDCPSAGTVHCPKT